MPRKPLAPGRRNEAQARCRCNPRGNGFWPHDQCRTYRASEWRCWFEEESEINRRAAEIEADEDDGPFEKFCEGQREAAKARDLVIAQVTNKATATRIAAALRDAIGTGDLSAILALGMVLAEHFAKARERDQELTDDLRERVVGEIEECCLGYFLPSGA